jgi:hypothetical protein
MQATNTQVKVTFNNETKKFKKPTDYGGLLLATQKAFGETLPPTFKFFYTDSDGDMISISNQEDLEEAFSSMPAGLKLLVSNNKPQPSDLDFSMRSSVNFHTQE